MVRRSLSFPGGSSSSPERGKNKSSAKASFHIRSVSLPCRSHPIISQIEDGIRALREWKSLQEAQPSCSSSAWLCAGLTHLELLHQSVENLLQLSYVQDAIRRGSNYWTEKILEEFLCFTDVYGTSRSTLCELKDQQSATQLAVRRQDDARRVSSIRSQKRTEKELAKMASRLVQDVSQSPASLKTFSDIEQAEIFAIMRELISITASATQSIFLGVVAASADTTTTSTKSSGLISSLRKKSTATSKEMQFEKFRHLEECIDVTQTRIERVFRSLINARVSILNTLSS